MSIVTQMVALFSLICIWKHPKKGSDDASVFEDVGQLVKMKCWLSAFYIYSMSRQWQVVHVFYCNHKKKVDEIHAFSLGKSMIQNNLYWHFFMQKY